MTELDNVQCRLNVTVGTYKVLVYYTIASRPINTNTVVLTSAAYLASEPKKLFHILIYIFFKFLSLAFPSPLYITWEKKMTKHFTIHTVLTICMTVMLDNQNIILFLSIFKIYQLLLCLMMKHAVYHFDENRQIGPINNL